VFGPSTGSPSINIASYVANDSKPYTFRNRAFLPSKPNEISKHATGKVHSKTRSPHLGGTPTYCSASNCSLATAAIKSIGDLQQVKVTESIRKQCQPQMFVA